MCFSELTTTLAPSTTERNPYFLREGDVFWLPLDAYDTAFLTDKVKKYLKM